MSGMQVELDEALDEAMDFLSLPALFNKRKKNEWGMNP